jgi:uncharacterized membrane protein YczE
MKKETLYRGGFYLAGILSLAFGITLSTRAGLGISPITSFAYALAEGLNTSLGRMVLVQYSLMLIVEFLLDGKEHRKWRNLLQLPFSLVFSSFLDAFGALIRIECTAMWQQWALLGTALIFISAGASMMVAMQLVPNPADALYMSMARFFRKDPGLMKNALDLICLLCALTFDLTLSGGLVSVGLGTVAAMILTGRFVYLFNRLFRQRILRLAGLSD